MTSNLTHDLEQSAKKVAQRRQNARTRVYVSGPMTGLPGHNFPAFDEAARRLRKAGYDVHNPATKGNPPGWTWNDFMRYDIEKMMRCDAIFLLPGWHRSNGARLEYQIAKRLGFKVLTERDL